MFCTYVLKSIKNDKFYIGHTQNIEKRLQEHNNNESKSTKNKGPWVLIYTKEFSTRSEAMRFEISLKKIKNKGYLLKQIKNQ
jgi:putative endonuclease